MSVNSVAIDLLDQLERVMRGMTDQEYAAPVKVLNAASIGQHVRHTLEFFMCLMDCEREGVLNYDNRKHDEYIQQDRNLALSIIQSLKKFLIQTTKQNFDVRLDVGYGEKEEELVSVSTNFQRELIYNIEHAIHHMALMKIGINHACPHIQLDKSFGVASSTLRFAAQNQDKSKSK